MKVKKLLDRAVATLEASDAIDHWQKHRELYEATDLLMHAMGGDLDDDAEVSPKARSRFEEMIRRRAQGEPVPIIKGFAEFRGIEVLAKPGVFVPRDSSEFLAEQAIRRLRKRKSRVHVDLACGGGPIALAVAHEVPRAKVYGADLSPEAVALARRSAKRLGLDATFRAGDLFAALPRTIEGTVDVITLHPPYVPVGEIEDLPGEILDWEPTHTLTDASDDGLGLVRRAVDEGPGWLRRNGWLLVEVSPDRSAEVKKIFRRGGFREVQSTKGGELKVTRVIVGKRPA